jgi:hypothetical protein
MPQGYNCTIICTKWLLIAMHISGYDCVTEYFTRIGGYSHSAIIFKLKFLKISNQ